MAFCGARNRPSNGNRADTLTDEPKREYLTLNILDSKYASCYQIEQKSTGFVMSRLTLANSLDLFMLQRDADRVRDVAIDALAQRKRPLAPVVQSIRKKERPIMLSTRAFRLACAVAGFVCFRAAPAS